MTEIEVEDIAGRLGEYFRRVFDAREGVLELHLSILQGVAARYRTPFFSALKQYSHRPTGVFHALPISQGKSIVNSHWIKDMVGFYGLDVFMAETSSTCGGLVQMRLFRVDHDCLQRLAVYKTRLVGEYGRVSRHELRGCDSRVRTPCWGEFGDRGEDARSPRRTGVE
jgi:hypothetical protein